MVRRLLLTAIRPFNLSKPIGVTSLVNEAPATSIVPPTWGCRHVPFATRSTLAVPEDFVFVPSIDKSLRSIRPVAVTFTGEEFRRASVPPNLKSVPFPFSSACEIVTRPSA